MNRNADDVVRFEIERAPTEDVRIVPVLVDGASMLTVDDLPVELGALATRNAVSISNERFGADIGRLLTVLGPHGRGVVAALVATLAIVIGFTAGALGWRGYMPGLVVAASSAGAAMFFVLRRSSLRWVQGGRVLVPALSVALFSLILLAGFTLRERRQAAPVTVTVRLAAPEGAEAIAFAGEVLLDLRGDTRRRPVDANGEALLAGVPRRLTDDSVTVTASVDGYVGTVRRAGVPPDGLIEVLLAARVYRTTVRGTVTDATGRPAEGITVDFEGFATGESDALGRFSVDLPVAAGTLTMLQAVRNGEVLYRERVTVPARLPLEVRLESGG